MKFQACIDCHIDPHKGSFKQRCEECHTTAGLEEIAAAIWNSTIQDQVPASRKAR